MNRHIIDPIIVGIQPATPVIFKARKRLTIKMFFLILSLKSNSEYCFCWKVAPKVKVMTDVGVTKVRV